MILACSECFQLRVPASGGLKAFLVIGAAVTVVALAAAVVKALRASARRVRLGWLAVVVGVLLFPLATLPAINAVSTSSGGWNVHCGKPATVFDNPALSPSRPTGDPAAAAAADACLTAFGERFRLTALIGGLGGVAVAAGLLGASRGGAGRARLREPAGGLARVQG